jgi:hypothetical protein
MRDLSDDMPHRGPRQEAQGFSLSGKPAVAISEKRVPIAIMPSQFLKAFYTAGTADAPKPKPTWSG